MTISILSFSLYPGKHLTTFTVLKSLFLCPPRDTILWTWTICFPGWWLLPAACFQPSAVYGIQHARLQADPGMDGSATRASHKKLDGMIAGWGLSGHLDSTEPPKLLSSSEN